MIETANDRWQEISVVNNLKWQMTVENGYPILLAENYFKFPEQVREFLEQGHWWSNEFTNSFRPGKSVHINPEIIDWVSVPIVKSIIPLLGLGSVKLTNMYGNCFNGNMTLPKINSAFPHVDLVEDTDFVSDTHIAFNINLTKSDDVTTGFWSFNGKKTYLDFNYNDRIEEDNFHKKVDNALSEDAKWFQIEDYGPWVLEKKMSMVYNSFVAYPSHYFHSPYIKPEWFTDIDRVTLAGFLNTSPKDLNFQQKDIDNICYAWEFFNLDKIHNYHPSKTKVPV